MPKDDLPLHRKFGYARMVEMQEITKEIAEELGVDPHTFNPKVYFESLHRYEQRHKNDLNMRQRQAKARREGARWIDGPNRKPSDLDRYREALEKIAAGHNDPRALAKEVLGQ